MHGFSSSFPHGGPGVGLLLLRLTVALQLLCAAGAASGSVPWWQLALLCLLLLLLVLGMLTPVAGALCALCQLFSLTDGGLAAAPAPAIAAMTAASLVLLGPGAYAADARLFGRRRLLLPPDPARASNKQDYRIHLGEKK
jgi:hypothetical protein